jgi:hypothetical protein
VLRITGQVTYIVEISYVLETHDEIGWKKYGKWNALAKLQDACKMR